jgi:sugar/nucleoside kinase (ribokinase family)
MSHNYDVLILGDYFCDLIFTGLPELPRLSADLFGTGFEMSPGGSYRTLLALTRLGLRAGWSCDFGDDLFSRFVLDMARQDGLDTSLFRLHPFPVRRISASFSFAHDRGFISYMDRLARPAAADVITATRPRAVLIPSLMHGDEHATLVEAARRVGALVYMDCQARSETLALPEVAAAVRRVDVFAPNEVEALHLTGESSPEAALEHLATLTPVAVIKRGRAGAMVRAGSVTASAPAIAVEVHDTTGAGDCFNAGFLFAYLCNQPLEMCLRCGNVCGGLATTAERNNALPTKNQMHEWLGRDTGWAVKDSEK